MEPFKIIWNGDQYKVSIPNYTGGDVVKMEEVQAALALKDEEIARLNESYDADMRAWTAKNEQLQADLDRVMDLLENLAAVVRGE